MVMYACITTDWKIEQAQYDCQRSMTIDGISILYDYVMLISG